jgi:UDP-N-acetylmuramoyl-L-alanyl-D-glutamate--2,6-diaminopimelate ligase
MRLSDVLAGCPLVAARGNLEVDVCGVEYDSRRVQPGSLFVAVKGTRTDGNRFVAQAVAAGAAAIVSLVPPPHDFAGTWAQVEDDRTALAILAANFFGRPTEHLRAIGVTGTNGKTTTAYLVESILKAAGSPAAIFGTIEYRGPGFVYSAERTTPEAPELQAYFRRVVDGGWKHVVMEVSSHAIDLKRVDNTHFDVAVFTNLTQDHLDYHRDMRTYFLAKKRLFTGLDGSPPRAMILNRDDPHFAELHAIAPERVLSFGVRGGADIQPSRYDFAGDLGRMKATFAWPEGDLEVTSSLVGLPNLYNIGGAIGVARALEISPDAIREGIASLKGVPGRFELIDEGQPFRVIVDYAHTDDALRRVLQSARHITEKKLIVVFGCGGDRDRAKRPLMGEAAAAESDLVIVTSDNPRSEDPVSILKEVEVGLTRQGARSGSDYLLIADRRQAIQEALERAGAGDTVLLAGKGHETTQVIGTQAVPFSDRAVAREIIHELAAGRN